MFDALYFSQLLKNIDLQSLPVQHLATQLAQASPLQTVQSIWQWTQAHITYVGEIYDEWQSPMDTITKHTGDCEDMSCLVASLLSLNNIPNWLLLVGNSTWQQRHILNLVKIPQHVPLLVDTTVPTPFGQVPYGKDADVLAVYPAMPLGVPYLGGIPLNLTTFINLFSVLTSPYDLLSP